MSAPIPRSPIAALVLAVVLAGCTVETSSSTAPVADAAPPVPAPTVRPVFLDGAEKSLVLVGYSTSYVWPQLLQDMLDEQAGARVYHVLNAVIGGSPVGRWIADPSSVDYQATYGAMLTDFFGPAARLRGDSPAPTIAIVQQSLQRTPTPDTRLGPVASADDVAGIQIGADALETLATQLRSDGIEQVLIGMHIYKEGFEPQVGNERFALDALLQRGHPFVHAGPDVWSLTIAAHPAAFTDDRLHPNELGSKMMAEAWYRSIAGADVRQDVIDAMHARVIDHDAMMNGYLAWRRAE